jgi:hypothetical protein
MTHQVAPFRATHVLHLTVDPLQLEIAEAMERGGPAVTLFEGGVPLAAGGLARVWAGVAEAWFLARPELTPRQALAVARVAARELPRMAEGEGVRRLQATVRTGYARAAHFVEWLGLTPEGIMRAYGPDGADHIRYAWVRPW